MDIRIKKYLWPYFNLLSKILIGREMNPISIHFEGFYR